MTALNNQAAKEESGVTAWHIVVGGFQVVAQSGFTAWHIAVVGEF
jgi:hypothetical protein